MRKKERFVLGKRTFRSQKSKHFVLRIIKGKDIAPLYQWLTHKSENGVSDAKIGWNFHKFLIDENGRWVASIGSTTSPLSQDIVGWIEE